MRTFLRVPLSLVAMFLLLFTVITPATAAVGAQLTDAEAVNVLRTYGIVRGDPSGNLGLNDRMTRAQAAAVFIRSMAAEGPARSLAGSVPFTDTAGHWGAGEIAMAQQLGLMQGDGNGAFRPDSDITYAEVLTVLLRMVGREPAGAWDRDRIWQAATALAITPAGTAAHEPAIRAKIFWSLATAISQLPLPTGQTILQKYLDSIPPRITLDQSSVTTPDASVTIAGTAQDAVSVAVAGKAASYNSTTGRFSYKADLSFGANDLRVEAVDMAGNVATTIFHGERTLPAVRIDISGPQAVQPGSSTKLSIAAYDVQGRSLPTDGLRSSMTGGVATFDPASATLTAGTRPGRGVLTLSAGTVTGSYTFDVAGLSARADKLQISNINDGRSPVVGKDATVKVQVVDQNNLPVTDDYGRVVTLSSSGLTGVSFTSTTATTLAGVATFTVRGSNLGTASLTVRSGDLAEGTAPIQFLTATRVVLTASPTSLKADGTSLATIRASLQDENGRVITNNSSSNIALTLDASGASGTLSSSTMIIANGSSTSTGYDVTFQAGVHPGTAAIAGHIDTAQTYSVQTLYLPLDGNLAGAKLQFIYPSTRMTPNGSAATVTVRVLDNQDRLVTTGSYAFQFAVTTSNGEQNTGGLPEGVDLVFPNTVYRPVNDGRSPTDPLHDAHAVVGRTYQGTATLYLRYNKSGIVTLTPKLLSGVEDGYNNQAGFGPAAATSGFAAQSFQVIFAGAPAALQLTVDSTLGKDQPGGAVGNGTSMVVRARAVDASGTPVPGYNDTITLTRGTGGDTVTSIVGANRKQAVNGQAEFTIQASNSAGFDLYSATAGSLSSSAVTVAVRKVKGDTPTIAAIRGVRSGGLSPTVGYVAPDADFMDIQLHRQDPVDAAEPHNWVAVKVYRKGESTPVYSGATIDLNVDLPTIRVPKANLRPGKYVYEVVVNNGAGETSRSPDLGLSEAVNAVYSSDYRISSALYDAATGKLSITASGLTGGTLAKEQLRIVKGNAEVSLDSDQVTVTSVTSSGAVLQLGTITLDPDTFNGAVMLWAADGWFTSADGSRLAVANANVPVKPMAVINNATLDLAAKRLYLNGVGFSQGTLALQLVRVADVPLRPGSATVNDRVLTTSDAQVAIALSQATLDAITSAQSNVVTAEVGWLRVGTGAATYNAGAITGTGHPLYIRSTITRVQYDRTNKVLTITGVGFNGGTLAPAKLNFRTSSTSTQIWHPGSATAASVVDDTTVTVTLSAADASQFETMFSGRTVLLNTEPGWLQDSAGRAAAPIPTNSVLFTVPAQ